MLDIDMKLNKELMKELGLEEGDRRRIVDRDTEEICAIGNKELVAPGCQSGKNAIEFDGVNNIRMMNKLFAEFVDKLDEEESIDSPCVAYGTFQDKDTRRNKARCMFEDGSFIESKSYKNENLALIELVYKLNGDDDIDLKPYDEVDRSKQPAPVKPKTIKKKMKGD